jgi:hypothetical protein
MTPDNIKYLKERAAALGFELREAMIDDSFHFDLYHGKKKLLLKAPYPDVEMWVEGAEYEHERRARGREGHARPARASFDLPLVIFIVAMVILALALIKAGLTIVDYYFIN